jgi:hypothetical protein
MEEVQGGGGDDDEAGFYGSTSCVLSPWERSCMLTSLKEAKQTSFILKVYCSSWNEMKINDFLKKK